MTKLSYRTVDICLTMILTDSICELGEFALGHNPNAFDANPLVFPEGSTIPTFSLNLRETVLLLSELSSKGCPGVQVPLPAKWNVDVESVRCGGGDSISSVVFSSLAVAGD